MDYSALSFEDLQVLWFEKQVAVETATAELDEVAGEVKKRLIEQEVVRKIGGITPEELEVIKNMQTPAQSMSTGSIESEEKAGWS